MLTIQNNSSPSRFILSNFKLIACRHPVTKQKAPQPKYGYPTHRSLLFPLG